MMAHMRKSFGFLALSITVDLSERLIDNSWLIRIAISLAVLLLIYSIISRFIKQQVLRSLTKWIAIPIAIQIGICQKGL